MFLGNHIKYQKAILFNLPGQWEGLIQYIALSATEQIKLFFFIINYCLNRYMCTTITHPHHIYTVYVMT